MSGSNYLLDTNIVLYLLGGDTQLAKFLVGANVAVSIITEIELLAYPKLSLTEIAAINQFLGTIRIIGLTAPIKDATIDIRKTARLKLPDAIIAATAFVTGYSILTADKAFQFVDGIMVIDY